MTTHDIIIIGAGAAGLSAAAGMAQLGMKTALIEKGRMGGDCLYYGCVPSKTLIKTARVRKLAQHAELYGLPSSDLPNVDAGAVMRHVQQVITSLEPHDSPERFRELGVEIFLQGGHFIGETEVALDDGTVLSAPHIIISTGSSPRVPDIPGLLEIDYLTNKDVFSLTAFPKSLITLGGGPIGVELSQALARLGVQVTIIHNSSHILPREDTDMAMIIQQQLQDDGITLIHQADIAAAGMLDGMKRVTYRVGGKEHTVSGEEILVALGRQGNTEGLNLEAAGVKTEQGFIPVDSKLRTNRKHVLALGDINGKFLFTHTAGAESSFAVRTLALHLPGNFSYDHTPWTTYTDPELASVGLNEKRAREKGISYTVHTAEIGEIDRANAEGETAGKIKILIDRKERIIGTQIASVHAGELITPSLFAVRDRWKLTKMLSPVYPYPTFGEIHKKSAGSFAAPKLFNDKVRRYLRFLFHYRG